MIIMFDVDISKLQAKRQVAEELKNKNVEVNANAFYMGIVVDNNDSMSLGRVKVRVPCIHGTNSYEAIYLSDEALPWARPAIFISLANDSGQFLVPAVRNKSVCYI